MKVAAPITPSEVQVAKIENIIEMALDFSGMLRVFEKTSNQKIIPKLKEFFNRLDSIHDQVGLDIAHADFCDWCIQNIRTAERKLKNKKIQAARSCSYGQAAKVLDIAAKVYVYYCQQPSSETVQELLPMLHSALDTPMMLLLDSTKTTLQEVDGQHYRHLQALVASKIAGRGIHPVQYDDVMWRRVQRS